MMKRAISTIMVLMGLASCVGGPESIPIEDLLPPAVGEYLRATGPFEDGTTGADVAGYIGPAGEVQLHTRYVGAENVDYALSELPLTATDIRYDTALGPRDGVFFTYGQEYHAAWGNGDWVFVLSAESEAARQAFLAGYGF